MAEQARVVRRATGGRAFLDVPRRTAPYRPVEVRLSDWREVQQRAPAGHVAEQASRCMGCGIPFCHQGCPLGNLIPEWNELVARDAWRAASDRLHATNNFPEVTGRVCPAPCEAACVAALPAEAVTIKQVEQAVADRAAADGGLVPAPPARLSGRTVAVVGSGPAGLAAAQQLTRAGHTVVVYERADRIGGLLRYGIPEFKLEKAVLDRRLAQMVAEGTRFRTGVEVGRDLSVHELRHRYDAVVLAVGATAARDLAVPGRELAGIHQAMDYLPLANRVQAGDLEHSPVDAGGRRVVIIGGGDTGADCLGTAHRQGAASVTQLEILAQPPATRDPSTPWPTWPLLLRTSSAHEEGGRRVFAVSTERFLDDGAGHVAGLALVDVEWAGGRPVPLDGTQRVLPADLVLLALGFTGPQHAGLLDQLEVDLDPRGNVDRTADFATSVDGVFVAGDAGRGQSLVVWAIAEGRACAAAVDGWLTGTASTVPAPVAPTDRPLTA